MNYVYKLSINIVLEYHCFNDYHDHVIKNMDCGLVTIARRLMMYVSGQSRRAI